jgi:DNA-binding CsgD family transcriptional regulator
MWVALKRACGRGLGKKKEDLVDKDRDDVSIDRKESLAVRHMGPGIMLLTASMRLLYKDRRAGELCQQIIRCQDGKTANGVLPPAVASLVYQIRKTLTVRTDPKDWEQIQLGRVVDTLHSSLLLCGTALIDKTTAETRILIVISEVGIGAWQDNVIVQATEKFQLTAREATVVQHLLKGWTNREIAIEMGLSEHTVKRHCKHLSEKTSTTTRTGIAMKIIHSGLRQALATPSPLAIVPTMSAMPIDLVASA